MALHYDYSKVTPYEGMFVRGKANPMGGYTPDPNGPDEFHSALLERMIWLTMSVDIGTITEANAKQFYARAHFIELLDGPGRTRLLREGEDPRKLAANERLLPGERVGIYLTLEEVKQHVGLKTNVCTETRAKWLKRATDFDLMRDC